MGRFGHGYSEIFGGRKRRFPNIEEMIRSEVLELRAAKPQKGAMAAATLSRIWSTGMEDKGILCVNRYMS